MDIRKIACAFFEAENSEISAIPYGNGHINDTYLLTLNGTRYLLQRINHRVFTQPERLMENIERVTNYLLERTGDERGVLRIVKTRSGKLLHFEDGEYWRVFHFLSESFSYDEVPDALVLEKAGSAFGKFLSHLSGFPAESLYESIHGFHDTESRLDALEKAFALDSHARASMVLPEMEFCRARAHETGIIKAMLDDGRLPLRVTHNDTKLNNALFDRNTGEAVCIIDLDTVMPGSVLYDYGDAIRSGANLCAEDEPDSSKAGLRLDYFEAFTRGFLSELKDLTNLERQMLPFGAKMMCLECGVRFLTDFLSGDVYFKINRDLQNLERCRTQLRMVEDLERFDEQIRKIITENTAKQQSESVKE